MVQAAASEVSEALRLDLSGLQRSTDQENVLSPSPRPPVRPKSAQTRFVEPSAGLHEHNTPTRPQSARMIVTRPTSATAQPLRPSSARPSVGESEDPDKAQKFGRRLEAIGYTRKTQPSAVRKPPWNPSTKRRGPFKKNAPTDYLPTAKLKRKPDQAIPAQSPARPLSAQRMNKYYKNVAEQLSVEFEKHGWNERPVAQKLTHQKSGGRSSPVRPSSARSQRGTSPGPRDSPTPTSRPSSAGRSLPSSGRRSRSRTPEPVQFDDGEGSIPDFEDHRSVGTAHSSTYGVPSVNVHALEEWEKRVAAKTMSDSRFPTQFHVWEWSPDVTDLVSREKGQDISFNEEKQKYGRRVFPAKFPVGNEQSFYLERMTKKYMIWEKTLLKEMIEQNTKTRDSDMEMYAYREAEVEFRVWEHVLHELSRQVYAHSTVCGAAIDHFREQIYESARRIVAAGYQLHYNNNEKLASQAEDHIANVKKVNESMATVNEENKKLKKRITELELSLEDEQEEVLRLKNQLKTLQEQHDDLIYKVQSGEIEHGRKASMTGDPRMKRREVEPGVYYNPLGDEERPFQTLADTVNNLNDFLDESELEIARQDNDAMRSLVKIGETVLKPTVDEKEVQTDGDWDTGKKGKKKKHERGLWTKVTDIKNMDPFSHRHMSKLISVIYLKKIQMDSFDDRYSRPRQSLESFTYDYFVQKYGLKDLAEKNLRTFCCSVRKLSGENRRARMFGRFCGIMEPQLSMEVLDFYLYMLELLTNHKEYFRFVDLEGKEPLMWVPLSCMGDCVRKAFERVLSIDGEEIMEKIQKIAVVDRKHNIKKVDVDVSLEMATTEFERLDRKATDRLHDFFVNFDVNKDGVLVYDEFRAIIQSASPNIGDEDNVRMYSEIIQMSDTEGISVDQFVSVCKKYKLLAFGVPPSQLTKKQISRQEYALIDVDWTTNKQDIEEKFNKLAKASFDTSSVMKELTEMYNRVEKMVREKSMPADDINDTFRLFLSALTRQVARIRRLEKMYLLGKKSHGEKGLSKAPGLASAVNLVSANLRMAESLEFLK